MVEPPQWTVVGGGDKGGILVRDARDMKDSNTFDDRLATGAIICQEQLIGERLQYTLKTGSGPKTGWVSIKLKDKPLLQRLGGDASAEEVSESPGEWSPWKPMPASRWATWPKLDMSMKPRNVKAFKAVMDDIVEGDFYGIKFPITPAMLKEWGPEWLTQAMHTSGTLPKDNQITQISEFKVVGDDVANVADVGGDSSDWGGAGPKALITVVYKNGPGNLSEDMFIKFPHAYDPKNERVKLSVNTPSPSGWVECMFYNTISGRMPIASPKGYFGEMSRATTNYILITERIPYGSKSKKEFAPGEILPAPPKYRDWDIPNVADHYYAHARSMAKWFAWSRRISQSTDQLYGMFCDPGMGGILAGLKDQIGPMKWSDRDKNFVKIATTPPWNSTAQMLGFNQSIASGFLDQGIQFIKENPHVFPQHLVAKPFLDKFVKEATDMTKYVAEMNFYNMMMPEYIALTHPNAQVDNAYYWRDEAGNMDCGILDWDGASFGNMPTCMGNAWMGAEADTMAEHEDKLIECFLDEYAKAGGEKLSATAFHMCFKMAQASVMYGCMANLGQLRRLVKPEAWKDIKDRYDPQVDGQFLTRCYYVQMELFLAMWVKRSPYPFFKDWMKRCGRPIRAIM